MTDSVPCAGTDVWSVPPFFFQEGSVYGVCSGCYHLVVARPDGSGFRLEPHSRPFAADPSEDRLYQPEFKTSEEAAA